MNRGNPRRNERDSAPVIDLTEVDLRTPPMELFAGIAKSIAQTFSMARGDQNKSTQLRRFYDEVVMWENKVSLHPDSYKKSIPQIKMLAAKSEYAKGRKLVDDNFCRFIEHCVKQINADNSETLKNFRMLFEAIIGFRKGMER